MSMSDPEDEQAWDDPDALDEAELPDEADLDDSEDDSTDTLPCPHCGRLIFEQAEMCPYCGHFVSGHHAAARKPLWIVLGVIAAVVGLLAYVLL
jgi:hypothetical protein